MIPSPSNLARITIADLSALAENHVPESATLEFKASPWAAMKEWCKDISALANSDGGCIVVGMKEVNGVASELAGIEGTPDELIRKLGQAAESNLDPRIRIQMRWVPVSAERFAVLLATVRSRFGPHMSRADGDRRFYKRTNTHVEAMNTDEVRRAVLFSKSQEETVVERHREHVARTPDPTRGGYSVILDFFPVPLDVERLDPTKLDMWDAVRHVPSFMHDRGQFRFAFDGYVASGTSDYPSEIQVHRTATVLSWFEVRDHPQDGRKIASVWFARRLQSVFSELRSFCADHAISDLIYASLTMQGCSGYMLTHAAAHPIEQRVIGFPPLLLEHREAEVLIELRPWLHRFWNACGIRRCELFDEQTEMPRKDWFR